MLNWKDIIQKAAFEKRWNESNLIIKDNGTEVELWNLSKIDAKFYYCSFNFGHAEGSLMKMFLSKEQELSSGISLKGRSVIASAT